MRRLCQFGVCGCGDHFLGEGDKTTRGPPMAAGCVRYRRRAGFARRKAQPPLQPQQRQLPDAHRRGRLSMLTGPSRAVVIMDAVHFKVELRVKGETPSQDKLLSLLLIDDTYIPPGARCHGVYYHVFSSKLSTVEVTVGHLARIVEAIIAVQVVEGSWPTRYHGRFVARISSLDDLDMVLLYSRDGTVPTVTDHGAIRLSRCVVSVEVDGELPLLVDAWQDDDSADVVAKDQLTFTPLRAGRSKDMWDVGFCKMEVTVAWSLVMS